MAAINTLGVLYVVESGDTVRIRAGRKNCLQCGKVQLRSLNYILNANGIEPGKDITIDIRVATEIAAMLTDAENTIAVLPQPYVTVQMQNDKVRVAMSLTEEWDKVSTESSIVAVWSQ